MFTFDLSVYYVYAAEVASFILNIVYILKLHKLFKIFLFVIRMFFIFNSCKALSL